MSSLEGHWKVTRAAMAGFAAARSGTAAFRPAALERRVVARDLLDLISLGHWRNAAQCRHFMRRFDGQSEREAYAESVAWIRARATRAAAEVARALRSPQNGSGVAPSQALGDTLHALQDSFAPGHAEREASRDERPGAIRRMRCFAGEDRRGHAAGDLAWRGDGPAGLSPLGWQAARASHELLSLIVETAEDPAGAVVLDGFEAFRATWLAASDALSAEPGRPIGILQRF